MSAVKHPYGYHYLGEVFVFIFFGLVATCGTMFALSGAITPDGLLGGSAAGLVAVAVLCVNNLRDIESDSNHGKHTLDAHRQWDRQILALSCTGLLI
ncbi:MAG: prenyltransferase [Bifidobacterium longum]